MRTPPKLSGVLSLIVGLALVVMPVGFITVGTGQSMMPTIQNGAVVVVGHLTYGPSLPVLSRWSFPWNRAPDRGELVSVASASEVDHAGMWGKMGMIKRVVGLPGDTLKQRGRTLVRNGEAVQEPYARYEFEDNTMPDGRPSWQSPSHRLVQSEFRWHRHHLATPEFTERYRPSRRFWGPLVIPDGHVFVLGDNRDYSRDSRYESVGFVPLDQVDGRVVASLNIPFVGGG